MKLKTTADGLRAVDINNPDSTPLDLTTPMPGNTVFEGVEVWQVKYPSHDRWLLANIRFNCKDFAMYKERNPNVESRQAYQPLEVKEQVREEAEKKDNEADFDKRLAAVDIFVKHLGDDALYFGRKTDFENAMIEYGDTCALQATQQQGLVSLKDIEKRFLVAINRLKSKIGHGDQIGDAVAQSSISLLDIMFEDIKTLKQ